MSVTAVPIRPIKKGSIALLFGTLAAFGVLAGGVAYAGASQVAYTTTASGLQIKTLKEGTGASPTVTDIVLVDYTGRLEDGTVFDTTEGKQPAPFPVTGVIPGFTESLQLMKKGGSYRVRIPSALAYGPTGTPGGPIPPNATLVFEVELLEVKGDTPATP